MKTAPGQSSIILPQCWNASFCNTGYLTDDASVRPHLCPHLFRWFSVAFGLRFRSHGRPLDCAHASNIFESWFNSARGALRCLVPSNPDLPLYCLERTCELENWRSSESSMLHKLVRFPLLPHMCILPRMLGSLQILNLSRNALEELPPSLFHEFKPYLWHARRRKFRDLRVIDLSYNKLSILAGHCPSNFECEWSWMISIEHAGRANTLMISFFKGNSSFNAFLAQHMGGWDPHVSSQVSFLAACMNF